MQKKTNTNLHIQSEERYKAFISQSTEGIWRCELEKPMPVKLSVKKQLEYIFKYGYLAECNDAMAKMYGFKKAKELIGARLSDLLIPTDKNNIDYLTAFIKSGYKLGYTESYEKDKHGNVLIFENNLIGVVRNGFISRAWGTQRDVTKQKHAVERQEFLDKVSSQLVVSLDQEVTLKEIAQLIVPYLADYCRIATVDEKGTIKELLVSHVDPTKVTLAKDLYESYKNMTKSQRGIPSLLRKGKPELMPKIDDTLLKKFHTSKKLATIIKQLGLKSYMGVPLIARGKVLGAVTFSSIKENRYYTKEDLQFVIELAKRIALTLDNIRLYKTAQDAISLRNDFISFASHELKTPLTSVKIFTQVLHKNAQKQGDEKAVQNLEKMDKQINKLTELIYDLLNISKIQSGQLEYTMKKFSFDAMLQEIIETQQHITSKHKLILKGKVDQLIYGDEDRLSQVVSNLLSNAIKYSPAATKVEVVVSTTKTHLKVSVKDFGIGMPKEHLEKVFERFYRVSTLTDKTFPGLGIGLYISKEIIARHQGKLWVESINGQGSIFHFKLPLVMNSVPTSQVNEKLR